jgi:TPR repeat protein
MQYLLATFAVVIACLLPLPAQAETIEETRAKAEKGDAEAQCNLGKFYNKGEGIEMNKTEAVKWFRKAAEQGNAAAQRFLGLGYSFGQGVEKNQAEAVKLFR